jgi:lysophospholipid acyltransferase (LPLAT)-like uncharacterized protein
LKKLLKSDGMKAVIAGLAAGYIWLVYRTSRWTVVNGELPHKLLREKKPFIGAFWHGRLLMMPTAVPKGIKASVMISQHGDGELIARTIKHWGLGSIRGSSSNGARGAIKEMLKILKRNELAVITPDGPRGPRMQANEGVVRIAAMAGVPIIASSFSTTRGKLLGTWDHFYLASPFSRGVIVWGDPIEVPRKDENGSYARALIEIEDSLTYVTQEADRLCGRVPVEPAPRAVVSDAEPVE